MESRALIFLLQVSFMIASTILNISAARHAWNNLMSKALSEYDLHRCGRSLSALKNFEIIGRYAVKSGSISASLAEQTYDFISRALTERSLNLYRLSGNECQHALTGIVAARIYKLNGGQSGPSAPNFAYRLL